MRTCAINVRCEWNCISPSVSYHWWPFSSTISHLLSFLQSVTRLTCSLDASSWMPAAMLYFCRYWKCYCTLQGTVQFSHQSCPTLCNPMDCSTPGLPVHHQLSEFTQTHVHWVGDTIHLILCRPLLLLPSIFPSIRVFSNELVLRIKWSKD